MSEDWLLKFRVAEYVFQGHTLNDMNSGLFKLKAHTYLSSRSTVRKTSGKVEVV